MRGVVYQPVGPTISLNVFYQRERKRSPPRVSGARGGVPRLTQAVLDLVQLTREIDDVQLGTHPGEELVAVDRLGEEFAHPVMHALEAGVGVVAGGEEDDR